MKNSLIGFLFFFLFSSLLHSQEFEATLQLRPRLEYRNGFKTLLDSEQEAITFISQRSRVQLDFNNEALSLRFSLQNVRTWGDVSPVTTFDKNGVAVFEAYAQYLVNDKVFLRFGRQILSYDNQRILGALDWAQQGQSHDAMLINIDPAVNHKLQLVGALNEDGEDLFRNPYLVNTYKNLQLAHYNIKMGASAVSFLFLNTGYEFDLDAATRKTQYIQTFGSYYSFNSGSWFGDLAGYGQTGERTGKAVKAYYTGGNLNYRLNGTWAIGAGAEYFTGTKISEGEGSHRSFSPLFGTNHGFNGQMDYFYVGNHFNSVGLKDLYGKLSFRIKVAEIHLMPHVFYSAVPIPDPEGNGNSYLGTEIDIFGSHKIRKDLTASLGYSQMFGSNTLELLKGGDASRIQNWAWVMISFHPQVFSISK
ncbi:hypothetical protein FK178_06400 [Antarcticibacterium arcticum]|uniref:Alginate export domain-containing protein n=1 Tax=Antarcticibacterium arcticum TaxID=2585771 RepID=A0A5B8YIC4_9FLAO|nr:alginate export family protein [Antarcticibacterium arcticum]QED37371.1 hypothetical protein FK178_06400 [Antarcticibacterium arcticum]